jgi:hypothetical protein
MYVDEDIVVDLAEPWRLESAKPGDLVTFTSPGRQLSVSILKFRREPEDIVVTIGRLYEHRLAAERRVLSAKDPFIVEPLRASGQRLVAFFSGEERAIGRIFSAQATSSTKVFVTAYFESLTGSFRDHFGMTAKVLGGVLVRG